MGRRRASYLLVGCALVALLALLFVRGRQAEHQLVDAQDRLPALRAAVLAGDTARAAAELSVLQRETGSARALTSGPDWWLAAHVPYLGRTPRRAAGLAAAADELTRVIGPRLLTLMAGLSPHQLHGGPGAPVDVAALARAGPTAQDALGRVLALQAALAQQPRSGVAAPVAAAGRRLDVRVSELAGALRTLADVTRVLPPMLGAQGPRRYLVVFQTNAEARGTGGLVGAYGVLDADRGALRFRRLASNEDLITLPPSRLHLGTDFTALYGEDAQLFQNANLSPHFPYAARLWSDMWAQRHGERLDGVLATDPVALAAVLHALGPVTTSGGQRVTAGNVVALTESVAYARFADTAGRKAFLVTIARSVVARLIRGDAADLGRLRHALGPVVRQRRLVVYSSHSDEEAVLASSPLGGIVPETQAPYVQLVVNNAAGNKLDYYLARDVRYTLGACAAGRRASTVDVRLTNGAPRTGLPVYVAGRNGLPHDPSSRLIVTVYATTGARLTGAELDGRPVQVLAGRERGHPAYALMLEIPAGASRVLLLRLDEPAAAAAPEVPVQPLVLPQRTLVTEPSCPAA